MLNRGNVWFNIHKILTEILFTYYTYSITQYEWFVQSNENPMSAVRTDYKDFELGVIFGSIF